MWRRVGECNCLEGRKTWVSVGVQIEAEFLVSTALDVAQLGFCLYQLKVYGSADQTVRNTGSLCQ